MSSLRNDLCRSRRASTARQTPPALPVSSGYPVLVKLRNRLGLCRLWDRISPQEEFCGPSSRTDDRWCNLRKSHFARADCSDSISSAAPPVLCRRGRLMWESGRVFARPAQSASRTDVCFLTISDHGRIEARPNSRRHSDFPDGHVLSGVKAVACLSRAVFHSKETGSDL